MKKSLDNKETLFTLLAAIAKREGGTVIVTEAELIDVTGEEAMGLFYNRATKEIMLKLIDNTKKLAN